MCLIANEKVKTKGLDRIYIENRFGLYLCITFTSRSNPVNYVLVVPGREQFNRRLSWRKMV